MTAPATHIAAQAAAAAPALPADTDAEIARHGIVRLTVEQYEYGGNRYSAPQHAIAEAQRRLARKVAP